MVIRVNIPSYRKVKEEDDAYTVFLVDVWVSGRHYTIEKRYSEFEELHKQLKKIMKTPEFPPKKVLKWNTKVLEQRRVGLDSYFRLSRNLTTVEYAYSELEGTRQGVLEYDPVPNALLLFLETDMLDHTMDFKSEDELKPSHQPVISLNGGAYLQEVKGGSLPDIVNQGVTMGLYSSPFVDFQR